MTSDPAKALRPREDPSFEDGEEVCHELPWQIARVKAVVAKYRDILETSVNDDEAGAAMLPHAGAPSGESSADH